MSLFNRKLKETLLLAEERRIAGRHVSLRPTKLCISMTLLSVAIWVGAVNYQVNVAYAICFWVLAFIGIAALMTRRQLLGLHLTIRYEGEVFAGDTAEAEISTENSGKRARVFWWRSESREEVDEDSEADHSAWQRCQLSGSLKSAPMLWRIPVQRRGYFPRPLLLRLATSAPFGMFHAECRAEWHTEAVVYPAPLPHSDFGSLAQPDPEQMPQRAGMHGDDIAFLKPHINGASLQHIAWKTYAKRGELMDKVFDEPPPAVHSEIISYQDYPVGTPPDKLASLLAHRVLQADKTGAPYTLELPSLTLTPQNGLREKCLNALALI